MIAKANERESFKVDPSDHIGLSKKIARRCPSPADSSIDGDDIASEAMLGIIKACRKFDKNKGNRFSTYAWAAGTNQIRTAMGKSKKQSGHVKNPTSEDREIKTSSSGTPTSEQATEDRDLVLWLMGKIDERKRRVVKLRMAGLTNSEVGSVVGVGPDRVSELWMAALVDMRRALKTAGITVRY